MEKNSINSVIPQFPDPKLNFLKIQSNLCIFCCCCCGCCCSEIPQQSTQRLRCGLFSVLVLYLHCLVSNTVEYILKNMNMYAHIVYNMCTEQRNHHPYSTVGDQDAVLREVHKETNQNKQVEKQKDRHRVGKKPSCHF